MSALALPAGLSPALAAALGGSALALVLWLGWRRPTWLLLLALAALAMRPQLLWGGPTVGYAWGLQQTLLACALAANTLHFGLRRTPNWPILALLATFCLGLAFGDLDPELTFPFMLESVAILALPFAFTQVALEPGSRCTYSLAIMLLPLLSVVLGALLQALGVHPLIGREWAGAHRLMGATGNAPVFATLAFAGLVVALHEATQPGRWYAGLLGALNFALVVLSATRMAVAASGIFVLAYGLLSADLRALARARWRVAALALALAGGALILYWPTLEARMFVAETGKVSLSGRDELWSFYYQEFLLSPLFGRGLGAGFIAASDWRPGLSTPHNEYLHLLVIGGVVGSLTILAGIAAWYRGLLLAAAPNDSAYLLALLPALAAYAVTDNLSFYTSALALYAYWGVLMTRPSPATAPEAVAGDSAPRPSNDALPQQSALERS